MRHFALVFGMCAGLAPAQDGVATDGVSWPSFRGERAGGIAGGAAPPKEWDVEKGENVLWKKPVAGLAHSSPVVWGDKLFLTTAERMAGEAELSSLYGSPGYGSGDSVEDEGKHAYRLLCFDKRTGEVLWSRTAHEGEPEVKRHPKSTHANSTPAVDGERVVAFFGSEGLFCYDLDGEPIWEKDFGVLLSGAPRYEDGYEWGFASSPVLHEGSVLVQCDVRGESFLARLDAKDGKELWRTARAEDCTWSTPTIVTGLESGDQVVVNGYEHSGGYDLETGKEVWKLVGGGDVPVPTPVTAGGTIYLTSAHGRMRPIYAVEASVVGTVVAGAVESGMRWFHPRRGIYMQTPLVLDGRLYACSDGGVLGCYAVADGEELYRERLGAGGAGFSSSAVAAGGVLYFTDESGEVHVVQPGEAFEKIGTNALGENCLATPAVSEGVLYFRTRGHLVAIGAGS
ncbi:MAG: PQQ-binding-like beta-propeller repeat protein [bacterium]|nr:PQQ-binding-like beta-propeller repeat protein [bacterium]